MQVLLAGSLSVSLSRGSRIPPEAKSQAQRTPSLPRPPRHTRRQSVRSSRRLPQQQRRADVGRVTDGAGERGAVASAPLAPSLGRVR